MFQFAFCGIRRKVRIPLVRREARYFYGRHLHTYTPTARFRCLWTMVEQERRVGTRPGREPKFHRGVIWRGHCWVGIGALHSHLAGAVVCLAVVEKCVRIRTIPRAPPMVRHLQTFFINGSEPSKRLLLGKEAPFGHHSSSPVTRAVLKAYPRKCRCRM